MVVFNLELSFDRVLIEHLHRIRKNSDSDLKIKRRRFSELLYFAKKLQQGKINLYHPTLFHTNICH